MPRLIPTLTSLLLIAACGDKEPTDDTSTDDTAAVDDSGEEEAACVALQDGDWSVQGPAFGMRMGMVVTMDVESCSFTITDWSMQMGSMPDGGTVEGSTVTLGSATDTYWGSCAGDMDADGTEANGQCADDAAGWSMSYEG